MKKLCFLVCSPFSESDYRQYGISKIKKLGFKEKISLNDGLNDIIQKMKLIN